MAKTASFGKEEIPKSGWEEGCYDPSLKVDLCFGGRWSNLAYQGLFGPSLSILILAHGGWAARGHHGPSGAGLFSRGRRATQHQLDRLRPSSPPCLHFLRGAQICLFLTKILYANLRKNLPHGQIQHIFFLDFSSNLDKSRLTFVKNVYVIRS